MSNVRLSNSPTLERMDVRLSDQPKPKACRNLFGPVDHGELKKDLKGHLHEMEKAASDKWNFDFVNHEPLPNGQFEWHAMDSTDVPEFYKRGQRAAKARCSSGNTSMHRNDNHDGQVGTSCQESAGKVSEEETRKCEKQMDYRDQGSGKSKRPAGHESSSQSKKSRRTSDENTQCSTHSVEHTPRKSQT